MAVEPRIETILGSQEERRRETYAASFQPQVRLGNRSDQIVATSIRSQKAFRPH
jgi:hypothetical protein